MNLTYTGINIKTLNFDEIITIEPVDISGDLDLTHWLADLEQAQQFEPCRVEFALRDTSSFTRWI